MQWAGSAPACYNDLLIDFAVNGEHLPQTKCIEIHNGFWCRKWDEKMYYIWNVKIEKFWDVKILVREMDGVGWESEINKESLMYKDLLINKGTAIFK